MPAELDPLVGQTVGGYRVHKRLGIGGMGAVYEAVEQVIDRRAALKILHPHLSQDPKIPTLLAEAKAANAIGDEGIVDIYGFGTMPDGRPYLLMELLEGEMLDSVLKAKTKLSVAETVAIAAPLLQALEAAHSAGFVHRDIKPGNVFLVRRPNRPQVAKLLDLGLAQHVTTESPNAMGTPDYIAPEQAHNRNVGPKADLYAFGCMMFQMLTGRLPFIGTTAREVMQLQINAERPEVKDFEPSVPEALNALVLQLMQKDPAQRPASAAVARAALLALEAGLKPRRRGPLLISVGAAVLALAAVAVVLLRGSGPVAPVVNPVDLAVAAAAEDIAAQLDAGVLSSAQGTGAVERLLAAEAAFPSRPEWQALRGRVETGLRLEVGAALAADDVDLAATRLKVLERLGPLPADDALAKDARRYASGRKLGMVRVGAVLVDKYEYPNREGTLPETKVDFADAVTMCERAGKHLCSEEEWEAACRGAEGRVFPYGAKLEKGRCLTAAKKPKKPAPAGSFKGCVTPEGVFDLSGNVAEWTSSPLRAGAPQRVIRGGSFAHSDAKLSCEARDYQLPGQGGAPHLGFRCCL